MKEDSTGAVATEGPTPLETQALVQGSARGKLQERRQDSQA